MDRESNASTEDDKGSTHTRRTKLIWFAGLAAAIGLVAWVVLHVWAKVDFCNGWASHYASEAKRLKKEASNPNITEDEAVRCRTAAMDYEIIAHKYERVAHCPWRPYPSFPLVSPRDKLKAGE